jgi:hypothetical protein
VVRSGGVNIGAYQASASAFVLTAPSAVTAGTTFGLTVEAVDPFGQAALGYTGTVHFTSTDKHAVLPRKYTFVSGDNGVHTFKVTLRSRGMRSVTVTDTLDGSITGSTIVNVL